MMGRAITGMRMRPIANGPLPSCNICTCSCVHPIGVRSLVILSPGRQACLPPGHGYSNSTPCLSGSRAHLLPAVVRRAYPQRQMQRDRQAEAKAADAMAPAGTVMARKALAASGGLATDATVTGGAGGGSASPRSVPKSTVMHSPHVSARGPPQSRAAAQPVVKGEDQQRLDIMHMVLLSFFPHAFARGGGSETARHMHTFEGRCAGGSPPAPLGG